LVLINLVDCFRNNFGLGFLAVFLFLLVLVLVALLVNLETVHDVGKEIKKFSVFVGYLAHGFVGLLVKLSLAMLAKNLAGLIILFPGLEEEGKYDAF